jgi:hypothetical protein
MNVARRRPLLVVAASLSVLLSACGVTDGGAAPGAVSAGIGRVTSAAQIVSAAENTAAVTSQGVWVEVVTSAADGMDVTITAEGAFDTEARRGRLVTELTGGFSFLEDLTATEVVYDGDVAYLKAPFIEFLTGGKPWVKIDASEFEGMGEQLDAAGAAGADLLEFLTSVGEVEELGAASVRGVATRHIGVQIDIGQAIDRAEPEKADSLRSRLGQLGVDVDGLAAIPAEVWVDDDGYVRRFTLTFDLGAFAADLGEDLPAGAAGTSVTQTIELFDFGAPVDLEVPPVGQVGELDLTDLLGD